jgi:adenosine kinase
MIQSPAKATTYVGCVGKDKFGSVLEESATKDNVRVHYQKVDDTPTGTCAVLIKDHERSLVANISAAGKYAIDHLQQQDTQDLINKAKVYYIAGFFLTVSPESALSVAKHSAEKNKTFCFNLSAPFICQFFGEPLSTLMPYVDILFANESEAVAFAESMGWETKVIAEIAVKTAALPRAAECSRDRIVVFTQGSDPTIVATKGSHVTYPVTPLPKGELVDSNGAGDAFVGGFLSQLLCDKAVSMCVDAGHYSAGVVIRHSGCTFPPKPSFQV